MKKFNYTAFAIVAATIIFSCSKSFLNVPVSNGLDESNLANRKGVESLLIGAYAMLDGVTGTDQKWVKGGAGSNWVYGSICGSEAYKGSDPYDQGEITEFETFNPTATNDYLMAKWNAVYTGVHRTNDVLRLLKLATDMSDDMKREIEGEARFLRAYYHFEARKMWKNVPFVNETISLANNNFFLGNEAEIWPDIDNDLRFAIDNLPETQAQIGRANKYSAQALLAKSSLFQNNFDKAKPLLDSIINSGRYSLAAHYWDNFNAATKNGSESVFAAQSSVNDGASGMNGDPGDNLNNANYGSGQGCCGFFQPSQWLVNHFKTDAASGLPDPDHFNNSDIANDQDIPSASPFTPDTSTLDPRLDWTVGRRGIPFLDWGIHPGQDWIRDQTNAGPYSPKKNAYFKNQEGTLTDVSAWPVGIANNINLIRYSDVLLWAAETEIKAGDLDQAENYVNMIRNRAADPTGWVHTYIDNNDPSKGFTSTPAANYFIKPYPDGYFTAKGPAYALRAVQYERVLELGMEGHRFFDLVRWGIAASEINSYLNKEQNLRNYLTGAVFTPGKNEYFPIPQSEIDKSGGVMRQNPGY